VGIADAARTVPRGSIHYSEKLEISSSILIYLSLFSAWQGMANIVNLIILYKENVYVGDNIIRKKINRAIKVNNKICKTTTTTTTISYVYDKRQPSVSDIK
jgi:hypothetical protein